MRHRGDGVLSPSRIGINIRTYITAFFEFVGAAHGPPKPMPVKQRKYRVSGKRPLPG